MWRCLLPASAIIAWLAAVVRRIGDRVDIGGAGLTTATAWTRAFATRLCD